MIVIIATHVALWGLLLTSIALYSRVRQLEKKINQHSHQIRYLTHHRSDLDYDRIESITIEREY